ncbi:hypothetical protein [uncultured Microbacterium sp.]|uniref:hypothetical protein n=1 Tax=uncultured Microbacterium sp. TaxID=191216 RepID=UPI0028D3D7B7|nr:hypothetical protein [uncultured Microbacterium sp.]
MALGNDYVEAWEEKYGAAKGWFGNWPPYSPVGLGEVGSLATDAATGLLTFRPGNTLDDYGIPFTTTSDTAQGSDISFSTGSETAVEFGIDASTEKFKWLGEGEIGLHASFGSSGGMQADISGVRRRRVTNLNELRDQLLEAAKSGKIPVGTAVVVEVDTAEKGMIVSSENNKADLKVSAKADVKPAKVSLASFVGSARVRSNEGAAALQELPAPFTLAFRTLVVGTKGIWWWKRIVIQGSGELNDAELVAATEDALDDDDYLARF